MSKSILTEYRLELGALLTLVFAFLTIVSIIGVVYINIAEENGERTVTFELPGALSFFETFLNPLGTWVTWIAIVSPIGLIVCAWWLYDFFRKTRELADLIDTPSKAKFVRNLDDIEYLAWSLPQKYEDKVIAKKKEFKI
jgi:H+/Cl- antiporter ClcA